MTTLPSLEEIRAERARRSGKTAKDLLDEKIVDYSVPPSWFHADQLRAWASEKPILAICAGWQSGKTVFLVPWLIREIQRRGPGDYGAFSSTFALLKKKFLPELKKGLKDLCEYRAGDMQFVVTDDGARRLWGSKWNGEPTVIQLGYSENPDSMESATLKAIVWDEPGQRLVPEQSYRTAQSRLLVNRGRMCLASRPYESGWYERLVKSGIEDPDGDVTVINFASWSNPVNPQINDPHWDKVRASMPRWLFTILYEGKFTQPLGLIYDCFDYNRDTCEDFPIPDNWNVYPGVDFGAVNTAAVLIAENPETGELFVFFDYHVAKKLTMEAHAREIKSGRNLSVGAGGAHGESGWREAARAAGLPVDEPPVNDVDVQIQCVYEQIANHKLKFFRTACSRLIDHIQLYSREVDDDGNVTDKIADKSKWHLLDALRYIVTKLRPPRAEPEEVTFFTLRF